jgi:hypothetical protein
LTAVLRMGIRIDCAEKTSKTRLRLSSFDVRREPGGPLARPDEFLIEGGKVDRLFFGQLLIVGRPVVETTCDLP